MLKQLNEKHSELVESADEISADKGYDSKKNNTEPLEQYDIKPVIDKRKVWQENQSNQKHSTRILYPDKVNSFVYDEQGHVYHRAASRHGISVST